MTTLPFRVYLDCLYFIHIDVAVEKRARYFWSLSFWDVPKSRATLSRLPFSIPWYFILVDLIILSGVNVAFMKAPRGYSVWNVCLLVVVGIGYLFRLLMQLFLRVQWFLSTLEHGYSFLQQPTVFISTIKFIISSLIANFCIGLIACVASVVAVLSLWMAYFILRPPYGPGWSNLSYMIALWTGGLGSGMLLVSLYFFF